MPGVYSALDVAELFGIGRSTVYRSVQRHHVEAGRAIATAATVLGRGHGLKQCAAPRNLLSETGV